MNPLKPALNRITEQPECRKYLGMLKQALQELTYSWSQNKTSVSSAQSKLVRAAIKLAETDVNTSYRNVQLCACLGLTAGNL